MGRPGRGINPSPKIDPIHMYENSPKVYYNNAQQI
jgi:hypothetical protein